MKKFLVVLLFLALLGGTVFFLGWTHLTVPPGSYGVMQSKTHGLDPEVIRDGEFRWLWYKVLPTNVDVSVFTIGPVRRVIESSGNLSSGDIYAALVGITENFSWEVSGEFSFSLKPEALPEITAKENIKDNAGLRLIEERLAERIEYYLLIRISSFADDDGAKMESLTLTGSLPDLNNEILQAFPEIENFTCIIKTVHYPDYTLYQSLKALYREYLAQQSFLLRPEISWEAEKRIATRLRLDELERYGDVLTRYPILMDFLTIEKQLSMMDEAELASMDR